MNTRLPLMLPLMLSMAAPGFISGQEPTSPDLTNAFTPTQFTWGKVVFTTSGEVRPTYERFSHDSFSLGPQSPNGYYLGRAFVRETVAIGAKDVVDVKLVTSTEVARSGGPRPLVDRDDLDGEEGFWTHRWVQRNEFSVESRIGRQEYAVGSGRVVSLREGTNVPLSFDGGVLTLRAKDSTLQAFALRPVKTNPGTFDDVPDHSVTFWGAYATHLPLRLVGGTQIDAYYLGIMRKHATYDSVNGTEVRHTPGLRLYSQAGSIHWDAELIGELGRLNDRHVRAWRAAVDAGHAFKSRLHPDATLAIDMATGGGDKAGLQTFYAFYQSGLYSGRAQILGPANTNRLEPAIAMLFPHQVHASAGWGFYWRQSTHDGLYGIATNLIVPSNNVLSRYEGSRPIAQIDWQVTPHLAYHANFIYVFNGDFEQRSVHGSASLSYLSLWATYHF